MKRTPLKRKTPLRATKWGINVKSSGFSSKLPKTGQILRKKTIRKASKQPISLIQRKIWEECKRIIRSRYPNVCYTCGHTDLAGSNWHTGHMLAKASVGAILKYDLRLLRPQCYLCNIRHGGRGADFIENMRRIEGDEYVDSILEDRKKTVKAYDYYVMLLDKYKHML